MDELDQDGDNVSLTLTAEGDDAPVSIGYTCDHRALIFPIWSV